MAGPKGGGKYPDDGLKPSQGNYPDGRPKEPDTPGGKSPTSEKPVGHKNPEDHD